MAATFLQTPSWIFRGRECGKGERREGEEMGGRKGREMRRGEGREGEWRERRQGRRGEWKKGPHYFDQVYGNDCVFHF